MPLTKGHKIRNTGRTRFKKGQPKPQNAFSFIKGYKQSETHKKNIGKANKGHHSLNEFKKGHIGYKGGYIDGRTPENIRIRKSVEYKLWHKSNLERDYFTCQRCGEHGGTLRVHHINNFADFPELRLAINNGITFCEKCHRLFHQIYREHNNTKEQLNEFLKL